jgi:phosphoglycolate phosphatase
MCTSLIFDFDGTLFDSQAGIRQAFEEAAQTVLGEKVHFDYRHIGPPVARLFDLYYPSEEDKKAVFVATFRALFDQHYCLVGSFYDHVISFLQKTHAAGKYKLVILTNKPTLALAAILKKHNLTDLFEIISPVDDEVYTGKEKKQRLKLLIQKNKIDSSTSFYIGDTEEDFNAATENEIPFIFAGYGYGVINSSYSVNRIITFNEIEKYIK